MNKLITSITTSILLLTHCIAFDANDNQTSKIIYLIGENDHFSGGKELEFQERIFKEAAAKKIIYAIEGLEHETLAEKEFKDNLEHKINGISTAYLYGVGDPFFIIFKEASHLNNELRTIYRRFKTIDPTSKEVIKSKKNDILCPLVHKSNQAFLQNFWNSEGLKNNPIFNYLTTNKISLMRKTFTTQTATFKPQIAKWSTPDWIDFTKELSLILAEDLKSKLPTEKLETLEFLLTCLDDFELNSDCDMRSESEVFLIALHLTLRNDFIINNLEGIYTITQNVKKPLVSILGQAHIEGVKKGLSDKGFLVLGKKELLRRLKKDQIQNDL